jgi:tetratricopeptide (TPR) repeat protein
VLAVCGLLFLAVALVFGQTVRHEFVTLDDNEFVYENPHVSHGLSVEGTLWAITTGHMSTWVPLTWLSLMLDSQLYGLSPGGFHLTNALLHAAAAIVLFLVLCRTTGDIWPSALVAAIFAVHPLRTESVAWVAERKDVLSGLFFMLTIAAYVHYVHRPFSPLRYLGVLVVFSLGLMAKAMLVTLPLVTLLLDYWPLARMGLAAKGDAPVPGGGRWRRLPLPWRLVVEKLPLLALVAVSCLMTIAVQGEALAPNQRFSLGWRLGNALISYVDYLGQFFFPVGLAVVYPRPSGDLPLAKLLVALLVLAGITAAVLVFRRSRPYLFVGWLWYLTMLVPVIGLVQFGVQTVADRFTYLPQIGLCIALAWGAAGACRRWPNRRWLYGIMSAVLLALLMGGAWRQTSFWHDSETLWNHTLACTSRNAVAHNNFGVTLVSLGRVDEAIAQYRQALAIDPDYAEAHHDLAVALANLGRLDEAIGHYQRAVTIQPNFAEAHNNLGNALADRGQVNSAIAHYQKALEVKPDHAKAHYNLARSLTARGQLDLAVAQYRKALELKPDYGKAHHNLAWLQATCPLAAFRNGAEAVVHAERAQQVLGDTPGALDVLAAAYAEAGRFSEAVTTAQRALKLAKQQNDQALAAALRGRIALYEAEKPFRQAASR